MLLIAEKDCYRSFTFELTHFKSKEYLSGTDDVSQYIPGFAFFSTIGLYLTEW